MSASSLPFFIKIKISRIVYIILVKAAKNMLSTRQNKNATHGRSNRAKHIILKKYEVGFVVNSLCLNLICFWPAHMVASYWCSLYSR